MKKIDPRKYNLSPRIQLRQNSSGHLFIVIDRKSRIIMKDGQRIMKIANAIHTTGHGVPISVLTSAPVCSKTKTFLSDNNISIDPLM